VAYPKEFSVVLFLLLVALCAYLLCAGKMTGQVFIWSLLFCSFSVAVIHNLEVVQRLQFKGGNVEATADFQRIRNEVYAKAEQVQQMTESVAGLIAENVTTSNRYGGSGDPDPIAQELRYREKLRQTLISSGTPKQRQDELLAPFAKWIPFDLRNAILQSVFEQESKRGATPKELNALQAKLQSTLEETPPLAGLESAERIMHDHGISSPDVARNINRYKVFLTDDKLP
jgi:hypothetical protein